MEEKIEKLEEQVNGLQEAVCELARLLTMSHYGLLEESARRITKLAKGEDND